MNAVDEVIREIRLDDWMEQQQLEALLYAEGIRRDRNLDYTCGIFDAEETLIATGSCFHNTIRCLAVSNSHRGEGLMNRIVSHLIEIQALRGNLHLFLYTKPEAAAMMESMGFYEITRVDPLLVFMENRRNGFADFCKSLSRKQEGSGQRAAIVMNANPFTLGHQYLVEKAARENELVYLFVLSEDTGPIPYSVRRQLVEAGVRHLPNVRCCETGQYMISSATFPSYFLKDADTAILAQAELDIQVFVKIAQCLGICCRYAGKEPYSHVTALYNQIMAKMLPKQNIAFREVARLEQGGRAISASLVRQAIHDCRLETICNALPESTYQFFASEEGSEVCRRIREATEIIHY